MGFLSPLLQSNNPLYKPQNSSITQEPNTLVVESVENNTIGWFRIRLLFNVTTDIPINMSYTYSGTGSNSAYLESVNSSNFVVLNGTSTLSIYITPIWKTFPREIQYNFTLFYINSTTSLPQVMFKMTDVSFQIILGVPVSIIIGGVLVVGICFISMITVKLRPRKGKYSNNSTLDDIIDTSTYSLSESDSTPISTGTEGMMQCPECKKNITEGSAFCPECGYHIPRFLRMKEL